MIVTEHIQQPKTISQLKIADSVNERHSSLESILICYCCINDEERNRLITSQTTKLIR